MASPVLDTEKGGQCTLCVDWWLSKLLVMGKPSFKFWRRKSLQLWSTAEGPFWEQSHPYPSGHHRGRGESHSRVWALLLLPRLPEPSLAQQAEPHGCKYDLPAALPGGFITWAASVFKALNCLQVDYLQRFLPPWAAVSSPSAPPFPDSIWLC